MQVVIRVDASLQIGTGHVMRCLTLAAALKKKGSKVQFICRELSGNLITSIEKKGFFVHKLQSHEDEINNFKADDDLSHASWLTVRQEQDAKECQLYIEDINPDWLVIDHYAIDYRWGRRFKANYRKLMVIDDLADRKHECDVLLDTTYGRSEEDYRALTPQTCHLLLGGQYALLRPEFTKWRRYSMQRRSTPELKRIFISMGGVDLDNVTGQVLRLLKACDLPKEIIITVVIGETAPNIEKVKKIAGAMRNKTEVKVNVSNMAELMANADLAIGAAGATTWERCCLGLPTLMIVLANNQKLIASLIEKAGAAVLIDINELVDICNELTVSSSELKKLSIMASHVTDGQGVNRIIENML